MACSPSMGSSSAAAPLLFQNRRFQHQDAEELCLGQALDIQISICLPCLTTPLAIGMLVLQRGNMGVGPSFGSPVDAFCCILVLKLKGGLKISLASLRQTVKKLKKMLTTKI